MVCLKLQLTNANLSFNWPTSLKRSNQCPCTGRFSFGGNVSALNQVCQCSCLTRAGLLRFMLQIGLTACNLGSFGCHETRTKASEIPLMLPTNSAWDQTTSSSEFPITCCCCVLNTYRSNSVAAPEYTLKLFLALKENCSLVFLLVAQLGIK